MAKSPCQNCTKRELGCHSKCELYIEYRREVDAENKYIKEQKEREASGFKYFKKELR